jgi:hypothetical protein
MDSAALPTVTKSARSIEYRNVAKNKSVARSQHALVAPGERIVLWGIRSTRHGLTPYRVEFRVGDVAVYDSYNLDYLGEIIAIGPKTVTIDASATGHGRRRLDIHQFNWRNNDFDLDRIRRRNSEWMD